MTRPAACLAAVLGVLALAGVVAAARAADRDALWKIVNGRCVPDQQQHADPAPCVAVDLAHGDVVLKDRVGTTQFLLIPTARITGIEDPAVLAPDAPFFADAWAARRYVQARAPRPLARDEFSLAVNAVTGRTQDQLHIHVECLRADVRDALRADTAGIGDRWAPLPAPLNGRRYLAMRLAGDQLQRNPFLLLADGVPGARDDMARHTLIVAGAVLPGNAPGFILLDGKADLVAGDRGNGENLQDHDCAAPP